MENKILKFILATVLGVFAAFAIYLTVSVNVPMLKENIMAGEVIKASDVETKRVLKNKISGYDYVSDGLDLVGKSAKVNISAEVIVLNSQIEESEKKEEIIEDPDLMEMSFTTDMLLLPEDLEKGDYVNVIVYYDSGLLSEETSSLVKVNSDKAIVVAYEKDEETLIAKIDLLVDKNDLAEFALGEKTGQVYITKNLYETDVVSSALSLEDFYLLNGIEVTR